MSGGLRKRVEPFVAVRSKTVNDGNISFRALGALTYVLDKPDGWDIRAEQMSKGPNRKKREGRDAIRSALSELAEAGYYRLERRQLRNGQFVMGTAVSETPVPSWAEQYAYFGGRAVPMMEQPDGSFLVKYPDGTLQPDDFPPPARVEEPDDAETGFSGSGDEEDTGDGKPGPGIPATGEAATGMPSPLTDVLTKGDYTDPAQPSAARPGHGGAAAQRPATANGEQRAEAAGPVQPALDGTVPAQRPGDDQATPQQRAFGIARGWVERRAGANKPVVGTNPLHQIKSLIKPFLEAGYTDNEVKHALDLLDVGIPTKQALERALGQVRTGRRPNTTATNGRGVPDGALRVNDYWDRVAAAQTGEPVGAGAVATW